MEDARALHPQHAHAMAGDTQQVPLFFDAFDAGALNPKSDPRGGAVGQETSATGNSSAGGKLVPEQKTISSFLTDIENSVAVKQETVPEKFGETLCTDELIQKMYDYFYDAPKTKMIMETVYTKGGDIREIEKEVAEAPPAFSKFARQMKVPISIFDFWYKKYPKFKVAYDDCKQIIKEFLVDNGLLGRYQGQVMIFVAKNETDMKDKTEHREESVDINKLLDQIEGSTKPNRAITVEAEVINL